MGTLVEEEAVDSTLIRLWVVVVAGVRGGDDVSLDGDANYSG